MAESLARECTPLKKEYDSCFNAWFEGYLEPAVSASSSPQKYSEYSQRKAEEFQQKCGKIWEDYRGCVHVWTSSEYRQSTEFLLTYIDRKPWRRKDWMQCYNNQETKILCPSLLRFPYHHLRLPLRLEGSLPWMMLICIHRWVVDTSTLLTFWQVAFQPSDVITLSFGSPLNRNTFYQTAQCCSSCGS